MSVRVHIKFQGFQNWYRYRYYPLGRYRDYNYRNQGCISGSALDPDAGERKWKKKF
jgi:hypothetical protein